MSSPSNTKESSLLFTGDLFVFLVSLWLTLAFRHLAIPDANNFVTHLIPFSLLFAVWVVVFFIAGLYDKHTLIVKEKLPVTIFQAQLSNVILAALFFFFVPHFGIAPKTNLVIYLAISFILVVWWRLRLFPVVSSLVGKKHQQNGILFGSGSETMELYEEVNNNDRYPFRFILHIDPQRANNRLDTQATVLEYVSSGDVSVIVGDSSNAEFEALVPLLANLAFLKEGFHFIDIATLYENIFDRVPLSLVHYDWYLENISTSPKYVYDVLKRLMDISVAVSLGAVTLILLPFIYIAIKLDDKGSVFIRQERLGKDNKPIYIIKFRSMSGVDRGNSVLKSEQKVTKVGKYLRVSRLDELPQLWNVLRGDLSLIGPRPELPALVKQYAERIPHYNMRHIIKPGLSGWAQINEYDAPRGAVDVVRTQTKLSYDLYYIKNRSFMLDVHIALKTVRALLARSGT